LCGRSFRCLCRMAVDPYGFDAAPDGLHCLYLARGGGGSAS